ncbi:DASH complex subunit Dad2-domain-containing protein [Kockiozyma suomiensis]|uniref:DASH complex subunit Dad2-domain-containing protein n=1 Tax=Kockiozyma suomiensis TaxID=1337062 RepID=UPI003343A5F3
MSYAPRRTTFVPTSSSGPMGGGASQYNSVLQTRIAEKKQELESLQELKELSASFARQMEQLQEKLSTLVDGTEAVALIVSNWDSILRAINMASANVIAREEAQSRREDLNEEEQKQLDQRRKTQLPEKLVRVRIDKEEEKPSQ